MVLPMLSDLSFTGLKQTELCEQMMWTSESKLSSRGPIIKGSIGQESYGEHHTNLSYRHRKASSTVYDAIPDDAARLGAL
jgi:hypothetical protein